MVNVGSMRLGQVEELLGRKPRQQQAQLVLNGLVQDVGQVRSRLSCAKNRLVEPQTLLALEVELDVLLHLFN